MLYLEKIDKSVSIRVASGFVTHDLSRKKRDLGLFVIVLPVGTPERACALYIVSHRRRRTRNGMRDRKGAGDVRGRG